MDQRLNSFDGARYTFSAKEKDVETGLSYFGSRYYSSDLSIWLSVDPMSAKYPSLSPYTYCADNPVKLVDPNGEDFGIPPKTKAFINGALTTLGGLAGTVGGIAACATGVGGPMGGVAISLGIPSIGLGIVQMYDAVTTGGENNVPGGVGESIGQAVDAVSENKNGTGAKVGAFLDIVCSGSPQNNAVECTATAAKILGTAFEANDTQSTTSSTTNRPTNNPIPTRQPNVNSKQPNNYVQKVQEPKSQKYQLKINVDQNMLEWCRNKANNSQPISNN
ncbi:MAG: RHS repeat-associated core domain-containing protein [Bacteroidales bacterium]|nr:RHS repeat-associated core domain-containing protein [Bacteroidales bacterium]